MSTKFKIITYDLCNEEKNYDDLYEYIKSFSEYAHITESVWIITTDKKCKTIRDEINGIVDSDDKIFVAELTGTSAWHNTICKSIDLKNILENT